MSGQKFSKYEMNPNNREKVIREVDKKQVCSRCRRPLKPEPSEQKLTCIIKEITKQDVFLLAVQSSASRASNTSAAESERVRRLETMQEIDGVAPHLKALKRLTDAKLSPHIYANCFYRHIQTFKLKSSGALSPCNSQRRGLSPPLRTVMGPGVCNFHRDAGCGSIVPGAKSDICGVYGA